MIYVKYSKNSIETFIIYILLQYHNQISILRLHRDFWHRAWYVLFPPVEGLTTDVMWQSLSTQEKVLFTNNTKTTQSSPSNNPPPLFGSSGQSMIGANIQQELHQNMYWGSLKSLSHTNVPSLSRSVKPKTHEIS